MISSESKSRLHEVLSDAGNEAAFKEYLDEVAKVANEYMRKAIKQGDMNTAIAWQAQIEMAEELIPAIKDDVKPRPSNQS